MKWNIPTRDGGYKAAALARQARLTKPAGALGALEDVAVWLADIQQSDQPIADPAATIVFASDHPVSRMGVSAYPREVTPMMVINLATGGAAASVLARMNGIPLHVVDVGTEAYPDPQPGPGLHWTRVDPAGVVGDLVTSDAMDERALEAALRAGAEAVDALPTGTRIAIFGEMGIGNTTPASAISARLMQTTAAEVVGPGTGVQGEALEAKRALVEKALDRTPGTDEPLAVLRRLGGREIAAIVGAMGRAAERGMAILVDGFIVSSAALVAARHDPQIRDHMWFAHRSGEPGHARILASLGASPLIDAGMRLGEGSGALASLPLIQASVALHNQMATFEEASVSDKAE
ncbi:MAG TPA: nicotinate-nucleotide--dimethylbenzimidazole phosphoribosyltransferase [Deltaproteobacteria bacterium]|nr:nicotinate-nucleotide--dimethylbenzimidazole phosphoribosyltransferase [Deltaproteobacteria bacterium]